MKPPTKPKPKRRASDAGAAVHIAATIRGPAGDIATLTPAALRAVKHGGGVILTALEILDATAGQTRATAGAPHGDIVVVRSPEGAPLIVAPSDMPESAAA